MATAGTTTTLASAMPTIVSHRFGHSASRKHPVVGEVPHLPEAVRDPGGHPWEASQHAAQQLGGERDHLRPLRGADARSPRHGKAEVAQVADDGARSEPADRRDLLCCVSCAHFAKATQNKQAPDNSNNNSNNNNNNKRHNDDV